MLLLVLDSHKRSPNHGVGGLYARRSSAPGRVSLRRAKVTFRVGAIFIAESGIGVRVWPQITDASMTFQMAPILTADGHVIDEPDLFVLLAAWDGL